LTLKRRVYKKIQSLPPEVADADRKDFDLLPLVELLVAVMSTSHWTVGFKLWLGVQASFFFGFVGIMAPSGHLSRR